MVTAQSLSGGERAPSVREAADTFGPDARLQTAFIIFRLRQDSGEADRERGRKGRGLNKFRLNLDPS